ncbi:ribosomal protein L30 [Salpingoeca rosetta]|uniref:Ribosomal protein L30 n=1 Tax=Salpingoeca rosetta (strain ATCC 50818 / BSB-021) TaxID=946362 RepID=F2TYJ0_SALR5|nr:ribosomal protein L30 [Salpingoeca rosetta]EGD78664.1 ribosomal protein L30 [Salpingoeca rosetta]|eukprot:XP_004997622.1 ribosomal protein L30 [Salpingoeca rosetta]
MAKKGKKTGDNLNTKLALAIKSGKYVLGYKQTRKMLRLGKAQLVIIASNAPALRKSELEYYALLSKSLVEHFKGDNIELGTAVGRYHRVGVLTITDPGDSDIVRSLQQQQA